MKSRTFLIIAVFVVVLLLLVGSFSIGMFVGGVFAGDNTPIAEAMPQILPQVTPGISTENASQTTDLNKLFEPFWQAWQIVHDQYVDQPVDNITLMRGAIRGMLDSLGDQHTSYMDPEQFRQANIPLRGEYEGIGAWVDTTTEYLTIVSPMPDSPAEKAGLKAGDQIIAIDGDDMTGIDGNVALQRVIVPAGTEVTLTILREGEPEPFDVTLNRAHIVVPSVQSEMLEDRIGYIQLSTFGDTTTEDLRRALENLRSENPTGLILDLRNNGGGGLQTAIEVASEFVGDGVIMYEEYGDGSRDTYNAIKGGLATEIPLVVLINEGSASASEIVAGAVQDTGRGKLVGVTSFGKGSVQTWVPLKDNQGAVRVTIARWLTPNGRTIHEVGLDPDVVVELTEEDIAAERDPQLDKAIELLKIQ
jgi:carboxyl-terminal processing protease